MLSSTLPILFLVPPVNLVALAAIGWLCRRRRWGRALTGVSLAALLLLSLPIVSTALLASLECGLDRHPATANAQAIVVLGAEVSVGTAPDSALSVLPGPLTLERLRAAAALARRTGLPLLVTGGTVDPDAAPVGIVMADSLRSDFATPPRWVEARSADTWQNAQDSAAILRRQGIAHVLLVTHAWHMRRALIAFTAAGLTAAPAPAQWDRVAPLGLRSLLPHASGWMRSYYALHEWIGCLWYSLRAYHHRHV